MPRQPIDWTAQDWLLVVDALARYRWHGDTDPDRAWQLIEGIATEQGLTPAECIQQRSSIPDQLSSENNQY